MNWVTMSEKFDGVNATWDGTALTSRDGNRFDAPAWFVAGLPHCQLVGELWVGRGRFEEALSIVTTQRAGDRWRAVRYLVFTGPAGLALGEFAETIVQHPCESPANIEKFYASVLAQGGEGIMLRGADGVCHKRKPTSDDDAIVVAHHPGRGRNADRVGALQVRDREGREFRLGAGLSDVDRAQPPAIGSVVKFAFQGRTARGIPRFASYLGRRAEQSFV